MDDKITIVELEILFKKAGNYLAQARLEKIELQTDYYLLIPTDKWGELDTTETVICSLSDDLSELKRVSRGDIPFSSMDLDRIASILRELSQLINPT